jgi:hypothetical protein
MPKVRTALGIERGGVRLATSYLEVESDLTSSLERTISREATPTSRNATRKKRRGAGQLYVRATLASPS